MFSIFKKKKVVPHVRLTGIIGSAGKFKQGMELANQRDILKKAFFKISLWLASSMPCLNLPAEPMMPVSLTCGTIFFFLKIENIFFFDDWLYSYNSKKLNFN